MKIKKIEIFNYPLEEIKKLFELNKFDSIMSNPYTSLEIENTPFACSNRIISTTTINRKNNTVQISYIKEERILALMFLVIEKNSNDDIIEIKINNKKVNQDLSLEEYLNITNTQNSNIEIIFENEQSARISTYYIYYLITPYKHDSYYFLIEYERIKKLK